MHCMRRPTSAVDGISVGQTPRWRWRLRQALADGGYRDHRIACARDAKLGGNQDLLVYVRPFSRPRMKVFQHADVSIMRLAAWHTVHRPSWLHARDGCAIVGACATRRTWSTRNHLPNPRQYHPLRPTRARAPLDVASLNGTYDGTCSIAHRWSMAVQDTGAWRTLVRHRW